MNRHQQIDEFLLQAHRLALERMRAEPARIGELTGTLSRWRTQAGTTRLDPYWDEWQALIDTGMDAIEANTCGAGDHATALRNVSPVGILMTQRERGALLRGVRQGGHAA